ncbi:hypothetical protein GGR57DRAFT_13470 [Xylariaceae sp. FL1272]|nr:hypothetical protein GGR57DRAFT_13470 [Xylariaceae sp. FL1272]
MPQSGKGDRSEGSSSRRQRLKAIFSPSRFQTLDHHLLNNRHAQRYEDLPPPEQEQFESSTLSAWSSIRKNRSEIENAANRLASLTIQPEPEPKPASVLSQLAKASMLERLPEEILISIMTYLDHPSLYLLTQTHDRFLRMSFDRVFESDANWRTFRHTELEHGFGNPRPYMVSGRAVQT